MRNTKFINLWALALVLASVAFSAAQAATVNSGSYDRDDQFLTQDGKVLPGSERTLAN